MFLSIVGFFLSTSMAATPNPTQNYLKLRKSAFSETGEMKDRWMSVAAMSKINHKDREKDLRATLKDPNWYMRNVALLGLDSVNSKAAEHEALTLLEDPSLVVRSAAVDVLSKSLKTSNKTRVAFWKAMFDKNNRAQGTSLWIRSQIMRYLSESPLKAERTQYLKLAEDNDTEVQGLARVALKKIK